MNPKYHGEGRQRYGAEAMTKPVPGAKRGRPPKPKPLVVRGKGRPLMSLRRHPDRYAVALFDAVTEFSKGERASATVMVELDAALTAMLKSMQLEKQEKIVANFGKVSDRLRKLAYRHSSSEDLEWRRAMSKAIGFAISAVRTRENWRNGDFLVREVMTLAGSVGEAVWAQRELWPLIEPESPVDDDREDDDDWEERNDCRSDPNRSGDRGGMLLRFFIEALSSQATRVRGKTPLARLQAKILLPE